MRSKTAVRAAAAAALLAGVAAPRLRRRLGLRPPVVTGTAALAPVALCVLVPRSRARDAAVCVLQMWAYVATYEMPADDWAALERRVHVRYPIVADRLIGLGTAPGIRLQRRFCRPGRVRAAERLLVWAHWLWFLVPHGTALYFLLLRRERFARAATHLYATFDVGVLGYWLVPTAPPWYAARRGELADPRSPALRRMMVEYGEAFWGSRWTHLYDGLAGNPLAAMPSLHFATSVTAARLLAEAGPRPGLLGWSYTATLGVALVYLGEHYVVDLLAGLALAEAVRRAAPRATPPLAAAARSVDALGRWARA